MRLHVITIGTPKLAYAKMGWNEYWKRLQHFHSLRVTHLADKWANDTARILNAAGNTYIVALAVDGQSFSSPQLANFLKKRELAGRETSFIIGGPNGLPPELLAKADLHWSFSPLTFPHDLAMLILLEALYRASTITAGIPYHK
jgi:23S rRNA (pseudouridine1915-N3)-methyltransferase